MQFRRVTGFFFVFTVPPTLEQAFSFFFALSLTPLPCPYCFISFFFFCVFFFCELYDEWLDYMTKFHGLDIVRYLSRRNDSLMPLVLSDVHSSMQLLS